MARKMKDSGIEWIGEIPEGWEVHRMKSCISQRDGGAWGDEATGETGDCICLRIADFDYEHFRFTDSNNLTIRHYASPIIKKLLLQKNDILIEKSGGGEKTPVGRTVLFDKEYPALFANFMDRLRCSDFILPQYLQYVFVTFYKNRYTQNYIKQTTGIQNLDLSSMLADEFVPVPNLNEQKLIVCYLESKCSKIDNLLSKTRSSIEEYKKLKQAVITQSVTKGVRGEREMKNCNIRWIKELPSDWGIIPSKYLFKNSDMKKINGDEQLTASQQHGIITQKYYTELTGSKVVLANKGLDDWKHVEPFNFIISLRSFQGGLEMSETTGCITWHYIVLKPCRQIYSYYYKWLFKSEIYIRALQRTCNFIRDGQDLRYSNFVQVPLFEPPLEEQKEIADYLNGKCAEIDGLIAKKEQLVKELESYKKSLIYEVVTGKREV